MTATHARMLRSQMWVKLWVRLATDINSDGVTANRVLLDIANEADSRMFLWEAGNGLPGMTSNYLAAMDALYKVSTTPPRHHALTQTTYHSLVVPR